MDYDFVTDEVFDAMIARSEFLEHANVHGNKYGTVRAWVEKELAHNRLVIAEVDVQGAQNIHRQKPEAFCMFVLPPSEDVLLKRLRGRGRDSEETIQRRFGAAKREIETARTCGVYDVFLINSDLKETIEQAIASVRAALATRE